MKKTIILGLILGTTFLNMKAQVAIGDGNIVEPDNDAILNLQSTTRGLLLPRIQLESTTSPSPLSTHIAGMTIYNIAAAGTGSTSVSSGLYYNNGSQWLSLPLNYTKWFYMPSIPFDTSSTTTSQTKDLYAEYIKQFGGTTANSNLVGSTGAPSSIPYLPAATDMYYYITDYDSTVFSNISINENGVMTYDVTAAATDYTFINIVFVLK